MELYNQVPNVNNISHSNRPKSRNIWYLSKRFENDPFYIERHKEISDGTRRKFSQWLIRKTLAWPNELKRRLFKG